ncbi:hypothetical protein Bca52824_011610 [Brassica carinata]|uniref:Pentatricopeptide repeat-containing protein n=1 Tax=Brassica carinata TaxID=52824 RepID=A0A8X8B1G6_BRACI|nr:hypothetical protein Bca52824_011610 [Brassica carinata]
MVHTHVINSTFWSDVFIGTAKVDMFVKCNRLDYACKVFDGMPEREMSPLGTRCSLVFVNLVYMYRLQLLILGYAKCNDLESAKLVFESWKMGRCLSRYIRVQERQRHGLIDMYSKCGSVTEARDIFDNMSEKIVVTWTTMIAGYAVNGVFLQRVGVVSFLTMKEVYNINPGLEHYSCMVDLLGRKGKLEEALELISNMSSKPDAGIWGALLSACKIHRNVKVAEQAAECLLTWNRIRLRLRNVKKYPGESVIQVDGKNHTFTVGERDHVENKTI